MGYEREVARDVPAPEPTVTGAPRARARVPARVRAALDSAPVTLGPVRRHVAATGPRPSDAVGRDEPSRIRRSVLASQTATDAGDVSVRGRIHPSDSPHAVLNRANGQQHNRLTRSPMIIRRKFSAEQRKWAEKTITKLTALLAPKTAEDPAGTDRSGRKDMALGLTEPRTNKLKEKHQRNLVLLIEEATQHGDEPELLARANALKSRAEGRTDSNLRIFGDRAKASTWIDWTPVDESVSTDYRKWFTECAVKPVLTRDGRFKFNMSGYDPDELTDLVRRARQVSQVEMDRWVNDKPPQISKTDWEVLEVLSTPALMKITDFLLFDKKHDDAPRTMQPAELKQYGLDTPIVLIDHKTFVEQAAREKEETRLREERAQVESVRRAAEAQRLKSDTEYRRTLLTARFEEELKGTGHTMQDKDVAEFFDDALAENFHDTFEDLWNNGPMYLFRRLKEPK